MPINGKNSGGGGGGGITGGSGSNGVRVVVSGSNLNSTGTYLPNYVPSYTYSLGSWVSGDGTNGLNNAIYLRGTNGTGFSDSFQNMLTVDLTNGNTSLLERLDPFPNATALSNNNLVIGYQSSDTIVNATNSLIVGNFCSSSPDQTVTIIGNNLDTSADNTPNSVYIGANSYFGIKILDVGSIGAGAILRSDPISGGTLELGFISDLVSSVPDFDPNHVYELGQWIAGNGIAGKVNALYICSQDNATSNFDLSQWAQAVEVSSELTVLGRNIDTSDAEEKSIYIGAGDNLVVAVGDNGLIITSVDGINWNTQTSGTSDGIYSLTYAAGKFVANLGNPGDLLTSTDGITWTPQNIGSAISGSSIAYGANKFVVVGSAGAIATSLNTEVWAVQTSGVATSLYSIVYGNSLFTACGASGVILTSPDGITWTSRTSGVTDALYNITYAAGKFIAVGDNGVILTSPDGITWTPQTSGISDYFNWIVYGAAKFVATYGLGGILTSTDGITWTPQTSGTTELLYSVSYGSGQFVAVGDVGTVITSLDGITWESQSIGTSDRLSAVVYSPPKVGIKILDVDNILPSQVLMNDPNNGGTFVATASYSFTNNLVTFTDTSAGGLTLLTHESSLMCNFNQVIMTAAVSYPVNADINPVGLKYNVANKYTPWVVSTGIQPLIIVTAYTENNAVMAVGILSPASDGSGGYDSVLDNFVKPSGTRLLNSDVSGKTLHYSVSYVNNLTVINDN